jgi:hypothetical protein
MHGACRKSSTIFRGKWSSAGRRIDAAAREGYGIAFAEALALIGFVLKFI